MLNLFASLPIDFRTRLAEGESSPLRSIAFSGAQNFRELGGYPTVHGGRIRCGLLYRSGNLHHLTDQDLEHLAGLSLNRIVDFRADFEKVDEPDRLPANLSMKVAEIPILDTSTNVWRSLRQQISKGRVDGLNPSELLTQTNIQLATQFTPQYCQFVREVLEADGGPILFHCTSGKDRTGFAAAILLCILGVSPQTVMFDYLLSNRYVFKPFQRNFMLISATMGRKAASVVAGFLEVQPAYLITAFESVDRHYGSFDNYVRNGLDLTDEQIKHLRFLYAE